MNSGMGSGMDSGMVPAELVQAWEAVYRQYLAAEQSPLPVVAEIARLSAGVGAAWRDMAATPGLPWWLVASLTTSAEAYERQARTLGRRRPVPDRPADGGSGPRRLQADEKWFGSAPGDGDRR